MSEIDIGLSKKEFKQLIKMAYIGMFVLSESELKDQNKPSDKVIDKLLQIAHTYKIISGIEYSNEFNEYFLDDKKENELLLEYHEFIDDSFWDELIANMSRRDFVRKYGVERINKMDLKERIEKEQEFIDIYSNEFEKNGIENIKLSNKK